MGAGVAPASLQPPCPPGKNTAAGPAGRLPSNRGPCETDDHRNLQKIILSGRMVYSYVEIFFKISIFHAPLVPCSTLKETQCSASALFYTSETAVLSPLGASRYDVRTGGVGGILQFKSVPDADKGGGGKKSKNFADVFDGCSLFSK